VQAATVALPAWPPVVVVPGGHATQSTASKAPGRATVPKKPLAHEVHAAAVVLPFAKFAVVVPTGHGAQPPAAAEAGCVTAPKKPGAQTLQAKADVLAAVCAVETPKGQLVQLAAPPGAGE
jgi:hypothetical protein